MNIAVHKTAQRIINQTMPRNPIRADELIGHDSDLEVPFALFRARMTRVQVALVLNQEFCRRQGIIQPSPNFVHPFPGQGSTNLNGLTVTRLYTPPSM